MTRKYLQHDFHPVVNWERHILESPAKTMGISHLQYINNTSQAENQHFCFDPSIYIWNK